MNTAGINPTLKVHFHAVGVENAALICPHMLHQVIFCKFHRFCENVILEMSTHRRQWKFYFYIKRQN